MKRYLKPFLYFTIFINAFAAGVDITANGFNSDNIAHIFVITLLTFNTVAIFWK